MRDGVWLSGLKRVFLWQYQLDLRLHRAAARFRGDRPWTLGGECQRCGHCCETPALMVGPITWSVPLVRRVFLAWQRRVNGFTLTPLDPATRSFSFRCSHYDAASRSCDSYHSRPGICRDYPRNLMWQPNPELHARCGHRASPPNAAGLRSALAKLEITPAQREKLRRGLRLDG